MMTLAIVMHKGAAGMTLGTSMVKAFPDNDKHVTLLIFLFAIGTPIGVVFGWIA
jgi:zinc transporter ZupT